MQVIIKLAENGLLPDLLIRSGIRLRHARVLKGLSTADVSLDLEHKKSFIREMDSAPIAVVPDLANVQHYEVPPGFFKLMLGPAMKYSCCLFEQKSGAENDLAAAEEAMLELVARRAGLENGMNILDLGCGWGSLSLWLAQKHPDSKITAVSNAQNQVDYINRRAAEDALPHLQARRADLNDFHPQALFDRIVSVEMFEHMRNWRSLLRRIAAWLTPSGALFVHVFAHEKYAYFFNQGPGDWMGRIFFSGGMMPSDDLMFYFQDQLSLRRHWRINGQHYARTLEAWLKHLDSNSQEAREVLESALPRDSRASGRVMLQRWRIFLMACAELFAWNRGNSWFVSHYLLSSAP